MLLTLLLLLTALNTVENRIPNVSILFMKTYYNTKINEIELNIPIDCDHI